MFDIATVRHVIAAGIALNALSLVASVGFTFHVCQKDLLKWVNNPKRRLRYKAWMAVSSALFGYSIIVGWSAPLLLDDWAGRAANNGFWYADCIFAVMLMAAMTVVCVLTFPMFEFNSKKWSPKQQRFLLALAALFVVLANVGFELAPLFLRH